MTTGSSTYQAGECNIDAHGVNDRKRLAWICTISGAAVLVTMFVLHAPPVGRFVVAACFSVAAVLNFRQASEHFCVVNGALGMSEVNGKKSKIANAAFRTVDREKAIRDILIAGAVGLVIGSIGLLPF
jgi:hypothetical protein